MAESELQLSRLHIHLDAAGGLAGDMFAAALLDALPILRERIFADLAAVLPPSCGQPALHEGLSGGIAARRFALVGAEEKHGHDHGHEHGASFPALARRIASASLQTGTADHAIAILRRLAEAESRMHGVPIEEVHFHEIADWDSLMDVIAAGSIAAALASSSWSASDLPRGNGLVCTRHGLLPVPAPATAQLLRGFPWRDDGVGGERVTPTGAAILAHLVQDAGQAPPTGVLQAIGIGAGTRELAGLPNILRALVFIPSPVPSSAHSAGNHALDEVIVLSFDIDDMSGEELAIAVDRLRAAEGVIDLSLGTRQGKKGRIVSDFRLLVRPPALAAVSERCFLETSTLGLRWHGEQRQGLPRHEEEITVENHRLRRKGTRRPGGPLSLKVASDDLAGFAGLATRRRFKRLGEESES